MRKINKIKLFSNHTAIFGNTGSGKSYGVARLLQNVFINPNVVPYKANFFIFDAYGEYHNAFKNLKQINPNFNFKYYTTNMNDVDGIAGFARFALQLRICLHLGIMRGHLKDFSASNCFSLSYT